MNPRCGYNLSESRGSPKSLTRRLALGCLITIAPVTPAQNWSSSSATAVVSSADGPTSSPSSPRR
jgi:hypothetical protein